MYDACVLLDVPIHAWAFMLFAAADSCHATKAKANKSKVPGGFCA